MSNEKEQLKEAFTRVKEDISYLTSQIESLNQEIQELKRTLDDVKNPAHPEENQTNQQINPADNLPLNSLKPQNFDVSIGNEGVPADRQTDQQTDRHIQRFAQNQEKNNIDKIEKVAEILDSLESFKKDFRTKFKRLTNQEMQIFSLIYQLSEQGITVDYPFLSKQTGLTESSIRDYIQRIIKKGIPLEKRKENNKKIILSIPIEFKQIASLDTIMALREL